MAKSAFDELLQGMGLAIVDIREKLVEEPMWGRTLSDSITIAETPATPTFQDYAKDAARAQRHDELAPKEQQHEQER